MTGAMILALLVLGPGLLTRVASGPIECTFSNPRYAGKCVEQVTPTDRQTPVQACGVILDCLNDTRCVKTYCDATTVRGGWSLESPKADRHEQ